MFMVHICIVGDINADISGHNLITLEYCYNMWKMNRIDTMHSFRFVLTMQLNTIQPL